MSEEILRVRGATSPAATLLSDGTNQIAGMNDRRETLVVQALPPLTELVRLGKSWSTTVPLANHFTTVAALPTTLANILIWNGNVAGGASLVIDSAWAILDTTNVTLMNMSLMGQIFPNTNGAVAAPTNNTACIRNSRSGKPSSNGGTSVAIANTAFMLADKWEVLSTGPSVAAVGIGAAVFADCYGKFIVPPGAVFGIALVVGTAAATSATAGFGWSEVQLTLG